MSPEWVAGHALIVAVWAAILLVLTGIGLGVGRALRVGGDGPPLREFWLGLAAAVLFLQIWHLWFPVDARAAGVLVALGVAGHIAFRKATATALSRLLRRPARHLAAAAAPPAIALAVAANYSAGPVLFYDFGLYHATAVRWAADHPVVPGLGHLDGRLAFNNSSFLLQAAVEAVTARGKSQHFFTGLLPVVVVAQLTALIALSVRRGLRGAAPGVFAVALLPTAFAALDDACGANPDLVVSMLTVTLAMELVALAAGFTRARRAGAVMVVLAATAVTVKLSAAVFAGTAVAVAAGIAVARRDPTVRRAPVIAAAFATVTLLVWMARGVWLSGWPVYPLAVGGFNVDWRIPPDELDFMRRLISGWARARGIPGWEQAAVSWDWVGPWLAAEWRASKYETFGPVAIALASGALGWLGRPGTRGDAVFPGAVVVPPSASLSYWFLTAPRVRFAGAMFGILMAASAGWAALRLARRGGAAWVAALPVLLLWAAVSFEPVVNVLLQMPGTAACEVFAPPPSVPLRTRTTDSGLTVHVAQEGDQVFYAPLPAAPYFRRRLRLRREGDLSSGFILDRTGREGDEDFGIIRDAD